MRERELRGRFWRRAETEARACGFQALELMSTLPGIKLYRACGYEEEDRVELEVGDGLTIGLLPMRKELR